MPKGCSKRLAFKRLWIELQRAAYRKLLIIDGAEEMDDLGFPPGNRLEKLKHDRDGKESRERSEYPPTGSAVEARAVFGLRCLRLAESVGVCLAESIGEWLTLSSPKCRQKTDWVATDFGTPP